MHKLSLTPNKEEYKAHAGTKVMLGNLEVMVLVHTTSGRKGSYERGFKFTTSEYGLLTHSDKKGRISYSANHGANWFANTTSALKSKGKVILKRETRPEFAFEAIQQINRKYDPSFKWKA